MATYPNNNYRNIKPDVGQFNAKNDLQETFYQTIYKRIRKIVALLINTSEKVGKTKEYAPPIIHDEVVNIKIKKPIVKPKPVADDFKTKGTTIGQPVNLVGEWDIMYAQRQQDSLHGKPKPSAPIDPREGRQGWINAYNATHANDFDADPLIPKRKTYNSVTFKLKDPNGSIPATPETFLLGYSRVDGCGVYRYYGKDIDAIKQHYNIEELYE
jgi:hypothetical protein